MNSPWEIFQQITLRLPECKHHSSPYYARCEGCRRNLCFQCWLTHTLALAGGKKCPHATR